MKKYDPIDPCELDAYLEAQHIPAELIGIIKGHAHSPEDYPGLVEFMAANPHAAQLLARISDEAYFTRAATQIRRQAANRAGDVQALGDKLRSAPLHPGASRRRLAQLLIPAAAAVGLAAGVWLLDPHGREESAQMASTIVPGMRKAILTLSDGRSWEIRNSELTIDGHGDPVIDDPAAAVAMSVPAQPGSLPEYSVLSVPRGGEFSLTLPDGTHVWLNAESELRFSNDMAAAERRVRLKGEAYFDVTPDAQRKFTVTMRAGDVTVYGTRFNLTSYEDMPLMVTLVSGSIGFTPASGRQSMLTPGNLLTYDATTGTTTVEAVDTSLYTSWIHNYYNFDGKRLEEIMKTLARWYDVEVSFESGALRDIVLSGRLYRYERIETLLDVYTEIAGVEFAIEGKRISVSKKR